MPKLNNENIVRYFSCWIEVVDPCLKSIEKAVKQAFSYKRSDHQCIKEYNDSEESLCESTVKVIEECDESMLEGSPKSEDLENSRTDIYSCTSDHMTTNESLIDII